jgi:two-component system chemotaxis response regulator CheB
MKNSARLRERLRQRARGRPAPPPKQAQGRHAARISGDGLVLVGTSTGGPSALEALLTPLPENFPWPILVAQHMPASFTGSLAKRLDDLCAIRIVEVLRPMVLEPGCVYVGRGDADLIVAQRGARLVAMSAPAEADYPWHPSTHRLVTSAMAHVAPEQLIGVLMTGMGDDGAAAMTGLRQLGGTTIAEAEETAVVWGMPGELVRAGGADWIEPVHKIAARLLKIAPKHATRS